MLGPFTGLRFRSQGKGGSELTAVNTLEEVSVVDQEVRRSTSPMGQHCED
ncbi:hypothetical protein GCM10023263_85360 [Phytohabitans rumicis]